MTIDRTREAALIKNDATIPSTAMIVEMLHLEAAAASVSFLVFSVT